MAVKLGIYKCEICGNMVEVIEEGQGTLTCCGEAMKRYEENTTDAAQEKHVPVLEKIDGGYKVTVGSVAHPMEEKHYITLIELIADSKAYHQFLNPGDAPVAEFCVDTDNAVARAYCNIHGLWKSS